MNEISVEPPGLVDSRWMGEWAGQTCESTLRAPEADRAGKLFAAWDSLSEGGVPLPALSEAEQKEIINRIPPYRLAEVVVGDETTVKGGRVGVVFFPGVTQTAASTARMAGEVFGQTGNMFEGTNSTLVSAAAMSSSVSLDTGKAPFERRLPVRAAYLALGVDQMVRERGLERVYLVGLSLGGLEMGYAAALVKKMMKGEDCALGGVVFFQSGGMVDSDLLSFGKGLSESDRLMTETKTLFPSAFDVEEQRERIEVAMVAGDGRSVWRLQQQLEVMERRLNDPNKYTELENILGEEEWERLVPTINKLREIDREIDKAMPDIKKARKLEAQRIKLLRPLVDTIGKGAERRAIPVDLVRSGLAALWSRQARIHRLLPKSLREQMDMPVAIIEADMDPVFPGDKIVRQDVRMRANKEGKRFPETRAYFRAQIANWAHVSSQVLPDKFGEVVSSIVWRMEKVNEDADGNKEKGEVVLHF